MLEIQQRQNLYRFFARVFTYPNQLLIEYLLHEVLSVASLLGVAPPRFDPFPTVLELEISFTDLFISRVGGVSAPPYGSVYLEENKQLMGQTTLCALSAYEGEGLVHEDGGEPPDFLATEMEFLYYLTGHEIEALGQGDLAAGQLARQKQIDFWRTLLRPWLQLFCQRILAVEPEVPLYSWAAGGLDKFLQEEDRGFSNH